MSSTPRRQRHGQTDELPPHILVFPCHRQVEQIVSKAGTMQLLIRHCHTYIPVSRSHLTYVKDSLKTL